MAEPQAPTPKPRIVVIDDHQAKRYALARTLSAAGFEVSEGATAAEAGALARTGPDVMVLDVRLPDGDGVEVAARIKADAGARGVLILLVSAHATSAADRVGGLESGADAYLTHPFEGPVLVSTVRALARLRRSQREADEARARAERLEMDLRTQRERLFKALSLVPVPVAILEPGTGKLLFRNAAGDLADALPRPFGGPAQDYAGSYAFYEKGRRLAPEEIPAVRAARGERLRGLEVDLDTLEGRRTLFIHSDVLEQDGKPELVIVAYEDITAQKRAELELQKAVRARDDFLSVAGHDLRSPLAAIKLQLHTLAEAAKRDKLGPERVAQALPRLQNQVDRAVRLVDVLFDVSRMEAGQLELERADLDLGELLRELVMRTSTHAEVAACPLTLTVERGLHGHWDRTRLDQVLQNLVSNALKYCEGKPVEISASAEGEGVAIVVRDHGPGIALEQQPRIFERYERGTADRKIQGLGLGLWIVRELVRAHGGQVSVESAPGQGAAFKVWLPRG